DGIRDFHVTGVQTCALPILHERGGAGTRIEKDEQAAPRGHCCGRECTKKGPAPRRWRRSSMTRLPDYSITRLPDYPIRSRTSPRSEERRVGKECRTRCATML